VINPFTGEWLPVSKEAKERAKKLHAALDELEASQLSDTDLRAALEKLADDRFFIDLSWRFGPWLQSKNRVVFGPFVLSRFSTFALRRDGRYFQPWQDAEAKPKLEAWLRAADERDDVEMFRRLHRWQLSLVDYKKRDSVWRQTLLERFRKAKKSSERALVLKKLERGGQLDVETALALYERDAEASRRFLIDHCPIRWDFFGAREVGDWQPLLDAAREARDDKLFFEVYRKTVDEKRWQRDVLAQIEMPNTAAELDHELERRHPLHLPKKAGEVFLTLLERRGRDGVEYTLRHLQHLRRSWFGMPKGYKGMLVLAKKNDWIDVWAALLRTVADRDDYDSEVLALLRDDARPEHEIVRRLGLLSGVRRELNLGPFGMVAIQSLSDATSVALYRRFPDLLRGAFRKQIFSGWHEAYPKLTQAAIAGGDEELIDYLASRVITRHVESMKKKELTRTVELLAEHYAGLLDDAREFAERAAGVLGQVPPFVVFAYETLLEENHLARLLWEHARSGYLASGVAIRDLLEAPEIHAQRVAFAALGLDDERARSLAAENVDLLTATLLRPLHRKTRSFAFEALKNAARHDESSAKLVLDRARLAFELPDKRYPKEQLLSVVATALHAWPNLRAPAEHVRVYRRSVTG
jgi:hypothetical protein